MPCQVFALWAARKYTRFQRFRDRLVKSLLCRVFAKKTICRADLDAAGVSGYVAAPLAQRPMPTRQCWYRGGRVQELVRWLPTSHISFPQCVYHCGELKVDLHVFFQRELQDHLAMRFGRHLPILSHSTKKLLSRISSGRNLPLELKLLIVSSLSEECARAREGTLEQINFPHPHPPVADPARTRCQKW